MNFQLVFLIFILCFKLSFEQCGAFSPRTGDQCHYYSNENDLCCYVSRRSGSNLLYTCYNIPLPLYPDVVNKGFIVLGNYNYTSIDCGFNPGASCSSKKPLIPNDCYQNSITDNNCCMIIPPDGNKRCVYSGNSLISDYTTNNGIRIMCLSSIIFVKLVIIILFMLSILE